eukprot:2898059-Amphidinium_carterae.1
MLTASLGGPFSLQLRQTSNAVNVLRPDMRAKDVGCGLLQHTHVLQKCPQSALELLSFHVGCALAHMGVGHFGGRTCTIFEPVLSYMVSIYVLCVWGWFIALFVAIVVSRHGPQARAPFVMTLFPTEDVAAGLDFVDIPRIMWSPGSG